tara:strand:+ start:465 stop:734 length:270 start_codon:yes stop_codon:yes gene_type:complete
VRSRSITKTDPNYRHLLNRHIEKRPEIQHFSKLRGTFHNHPSGDPTPSRPDIDMTKQIVEAGKALKIAVHDHLVVGRDGVASFKALGLM